MLKRLSVALAALFSFVHLASAAGTIPFSLSQQFDERGNPLGGCRLFTIQAGTVSTPQNAYQDADLTIPLPNPIECDAAGRLPQFFLDDGNIKVRLTDKNGVTQVVADNVLVIGPSSGGGGGGGGQVDPTTVASTGDVKYRYGTGSISGWVRANGRSIGSASSGATERANADCQPLFEYLWATDSTLVVSGGRGSSSTADWLANKSISLPDARGFALAGLADMGNSESSIFSDATFTKGNATTIGSYLGAARRSLSVANIPPHTHSGTTDSGGLHNHSYLDNQVYGTGSLGSGGAAGAGDVRRNTDMGGTHTHSFTTNYGNGLSGSAFDAVSPYLLVTTYIKL